MKTAVFIDTMSIQKYIFSSNSLKENIGASYLVKKMFEELKNQYSYSYVGGGNALLYFEDKDSAVEAMRKWSCKILKDYPGVKPVIVIEPNFDESDFSSMRTKIVRQSFLQKNRFVPVTSLMSFGFNAECRSTGLSAEVFGGYDMEQKYVSAESYSKVKASKDADRALKAEFEKFLQGKEFPNELENLGGAKGENNHIAVVHIDGNDLGEKLKNIKSEDDLIDFSIKLEQATKNSFIAMLNQLLSDWDKIAKTLRLKPDFLPLRPIIIGGDDITFVCDARLGLYLTYYFIKNFENQEICKEKNITACGGISIVKTKYPFYRAYLLAEELCSNAKKVRKEKKKEGSYIDFHISFGGLGGGLEDIRDEHYKSLDNKQLYKRPYSLEDIEKFVNAMVELRDNFPQSKVKKLREVLYEGEISTKEFIEEMKYRGLQLPVFSHSEEAEKGFADGETPYLDMIEIMDFYPKDFKGGVK